MARREISVEKINTRARENETEARAVRCELPTIKDMTGSLPFIEERVGENYMLALFSSGVTMNISLYIFL